MNMYGLLLAKKLSGGGGGSSTLVSKTITANGTYNPADDNADGYSSVTANVPNTYTVADEGKVVDSGALVGQTAKNIDANGLYDTTLNNSVSVDVPNSYTAGDEGKVVSQGDLVSQTAYPSTIVANGTYDTTLNNSVTVDVPPLPAETKSVIFYDYDGTEVYSYTPTEFAALSAMPANPTHSGLTAQGWNWTLADAKTYVANYGALNIGQLYVTDDSKTRLYCTFGEGCLNPYVYVTATQTADIDWGDGTTTTINSGTQNVGHVYASAGDYVISLGVGIALEMYNDSVSFASSVVNGGSLPVLSSNMKYISALTKVELGVTQRNLTKFPLCKSLRTITVTDSITKVDAGAFRESSALQSINLPNGVTSIGNAAFDKCYALTAITLPKTLQNLPDGTQFRSCVSLKSITLPTGITTLRMYTLQNCYALEWLVAPNVTIVGNSALTNNYSLKRMITSYITNAYSLKELIVPPTATSIYVANCYGITSINVPNGVTAATVTGNYSLTAITLPDSLTSMVLTGNYNLKSVTVPSRLTSISTQCFENCLSMESVMILGNITSIHVSAFHNCYALRSIDLGNSLTNIGNTAFQNCYALGAIEIPATVTSIGTNAFQNCHSMGKITINKPEGSISGAPWGAPSDVQIVWTG